MFELFVYGREWFVCCWPLLLDLNRGEGQKGVHECVLPLLFRRMEGAGGTGDLSIPIWIALYWQVYRPPDAIDAARVEVVERREETSIPGRLKED